MSRHGGAASIPVDGPQPVPVIAIPRSPRADRRLPPALLIVSATALGIAIQVRDGLYKPSGIFSLTVALFACAAACLLPAVAAFETLRTRPLTKLLGLGLAIEFVVLLIHDLPGSWHGVESDWQFRFAIICAAVLAAGMLLFAQFARICFGLLVATFVLIGTWIIINVPRPYMDVWMVQMQTLRQFELRGVNPYAAAYADPYERPELYAPGVIVNGLVHQGYPYPPVAFWMALGGYGIADDYRYASLAAMAGAALLIGFARPGRIGMLAATLFLFTPRVFFVLESGWTEPFSAVLLAAVVFFACRIEWPSKRSGSSSKTPAEPKPLTVAATLGLFIASKQYLVFVLPLSILLLGERIDWRRVGRFGAMVFGAGCVVSLPLIVWNVPAFLQSTAGFAGAAGFRTDALNYLAMFAQMTGHVPLPSFASACGFVAAIVGIVITLRRCPRTPAGFAMAIALVYYLFFAFYKFAFCNYYYLILAACCCGIGASAAAEET